MGDCIYIIVNLVVRPSILERGVYLLAVAVDRLDVADLLVVLQVDVQRDLEELLHVLLARRGLLTVAVSWGQLYKNRSSRKINSQRLFSRE